VLHMQCEAGPEVEVSPAEVLAVPLTDLRAAGLSGQKAAYISDLAAHYADGRLTDAALQGAHTTDDHPGVVKYVWPDDHLALGCSLCCSDASAATALKCSLGSLVLQHAKPLVRHPKQSADLCLLYLAQA
jgi:hypothetical protein